MPPGQPSGDTRETAENRGLEVRGRVQVGDLNASVAGHMVAAEAHGRGRDCRAKDRAQPKGQGESKEEPLKS